MKRRKTAWFLLICLVTYSFTSLSAQTEQDWYVGKTITDISFSGLSRISTNELRGITQPFIGQEFSEPLFLDLQRRLYALDYFEYLLPEARPGDDDYSTVILHFEVEERPVVGGIEFQGVTRFRITELLDSITLSQGDLYTAGSTRTAAANLSAFYRDQGYPDVSVTQNIEDLEDGSKQVTFIIDEGPQVTIRTITFQGNAFGTNGALKRVLTSKEQGLFNPGLFKEENIAADKEALLEYYQENGFIDAEIQEVVTTPVESDDPTQSRVDVAFIIQEGERWVYDGITISGNTIFSTEELLSKIRQKPGSILNLPQFRNGVQQVIDVYFQNGYFNNEISLNENRNDGEQTIGFELVIKEKPRSYIEDIVIRGNNKTKDHVIQRELPFETGDIFSAKKIREGLLNLYNLQYFEGIPIVDTPQGSEPELRNVVITLEERGTLDIRGGVSIGGSGQGGLLLSVSDINFLGNGQRLGAELNLNTTDQQLSFNFSDAWLFGERFSGGINLTLGHSKKSDELQDSLGPVFSDSDTNRVPDPFTGDYVFSKDTEFNGTEYTAGDYFPGIPSSDQISQYSLQTDYVYAGGSGAVPSEYRMSYDQYNISLGVNTGIRRRTPLGWLGANASISGSLNYVTYDPDVYRPFSPALRDNLDQIRLVNQLGLSVSLDDRDVAFNPSSGYYLSQNVNFTGGFLFGNRHYIRSDSTLQGYLTLFDIPVAEVWNWKMVLAANSSLSLMFPQFWTLEGNNFAPGENLLYTNGMTVARGWAPRSNGEAIWNNWVELRMPISEDIVWFDMFFEGVRLTEIREDIFSGGSEGWMFGFGAGLRLTIPQLPLRLYLGKRFEVSEIGEVEWQQGNLFPDPDKPGSGIDFIFAISLF